METNESKRSREEVLALASAISSLSSAEDRIADGLFRDEREALLGIVEDVRKAKSLLYGLLTVGDLAGAKALKAGDEQRVG